MTPRGMLAVALVVVAFVGGPAFGGSALASELPVDVVSVEFVGDDSTRFEIDGRRYAGPLRFTVFRDGVTMTERATIEQYLHGIAEMPFLWNSEALQAQAVAARTYLARTLLGGRGGEAATYGYDICATSRCQVYKGVELVEGDHGDRWRDAVDATEDELVLDAGRPIEAVYSSSAGSRTRANQDIWPSDPVPYLQPVDSPEVGIAPFATWTIDLGADQFVQILQADGHAVGGSLIALEVDDPPEGLGRAGLTVVTSGGTDELLAPSLRGVFNRRGDDLYPGALPAIQRSGVELPQPLPSATFSIRHVVVPQRAADAFLPAADTPVRDRIVIDGEGWGHGVGMSQWGARIMADDGADHGEILAHYYGGLAPEPAPDLVPDTVVVGLATARGAIDIESDGASAVLINGVPAGELPAGTWRVWPTLSGITVTGPDGTPAFDATIRHWPR